MWCKWASKVLFQLSLFFVHCGSVCKDRITARFDGANVFEDFTDKKNFTLQEDLVRASRTVANEALSLLHLRNNPVPGGAAHSYTIDPEASQCAWLEVHPCYSTYNM